MKIALALSILTAGVLLAVDHSDTDAKSKLKPLQKDLVVTLKEVADITDRLREQAGMSALDVLHAKRELLDATLDASETQQERVRILESIVELQRKIEAAAEAGRDAARNSYLDVLRTKVARIKAEIALEKEKLNGVK